MIPLPITIISKIVGAGIIPLGLASQHTLDASGNRIEKKRVTHDASMPPPSNHSINEDTLDDLLAPCIYGTCLRRITHAIHSMRLHFPKTPILISKSDLDAWYRRLHVIPDLAVRFITIVKNIGNIFTRLPFGVSAGPSKSSQVSEATFDLTNDILKDPTWDPKLLHSPHQDLFGKIEYEAPYTPYGNAQALVVPIPYRTTTCDGYLDDCISIGVDIEDNVFRIQNASPLAIHTIFKPVYNEEDKTLSRDDVLSLRKTHGEGTP